MIDSSDARLWAGALFWIAMLTLVGVSLYDAWRSFSRRNRRRHSRGAPAVRIPVRPRAVR